MKKFIALVVVLCAVMISSSASAMASWRWIYYDKYRTIYVDKNSIRRDYNYRGYVFRAFVKWIHSEAGRQKEIEHYRSNGLPLPRGIYNLSDTVELYYFKEENGIKYCDMLNCVFYDNKGNAIPDMGFSKNTLKWNVITPDTLGEWIFDAVQTIANGHSILQLPFAR